MNKRFFSMVLVLSMSLSTTAMASTVSDEVPLSVAHGDVVSSDMGNLEQSSRITPNAENVIGTEQPDEPLRYPLDFDKNGYDEVVIELDPFSTDVNDTNSDESISLEDGNSIDTNIEEGVEPNASTPEDYPITSFTNVWVSGKEMNDLGVVTSVKEIVNTHEDTSALSQYWAKSQFLSKEGVRICFYLDGYSGFGEVIKSNGKGYNVHRASTRGTNLDADGAATAFYEEYEVCNIDPALTHLELRFTGWSRDNETQWIREVYLKFAGDRGPAPTSPEFYFDPDSPEQYTLRGLADNMEYRRGYYGSWKPCTGESMSFSTKFAGEDFLVRYQATDGKLESEFLEVTMPSLRAAPTASINWFDESFRNLTTDMMFSVGKDGTPSKVTHEMIDKGIKPLLDEVHGTEYVPLCIWYPATSEQPASAVQTIKLYPRADAPVLSGSVDPNTYILTGVTSSMQYIGPEDTAWKAISGTSVNLSNYAKAGKTVFINVRTKSSTGKSYSTPVPVELPPAAPIPNLDIDYDNEKITGFQSGIKYQYKIGSGSWTSLTPKGNEFSIASLITSKNRDISIRIAGTADSRLSGSWERQLPARIAAPVCSFVYNDSAHVGSAVLTGLESGMEYQLKGETSWTPYLGQNIVMTLPSANKTYYVRIAATGSSFASTKKTLTLYAPGTAPTSSLNITTENITISKTAEYRINNGEYTKLPSGSTTLSVHEYINQLSGAETCIITVRFAATETRPASKEKTIKLVARRDGPTTIQFDAASQKITGATTSMQYRVKGTTAWKSVTSKSFSVASLLEGQTNIILEFRYKPANSLVGSWVQELECF